ncbi:unnamed protein product [Cutaneotrichosporon oleaginosum]
MGEMLCVTRDWFIGWQEGVRVEAKRRWLRNGQKEEEGEVTSGHRGASSPPNTAPASVTGLNRGQKRKRE